MVRTPVLLTAILALGAVQVSAQDHIWSESRPDGVAPPGIFADRNLAAGELIVSGTYSNTDLSGVRFGTQFLSIDQTFDLFDIVPLSLSTESVEVRLAFGVSDQLTIAARTGFVRKSREQISENQFFIFEVEDMADSEVHLLYEVAEEGAVRAHLQAGLSLPTGSIEESADLTGVRAGVLPYDMQTGAGVPGFLPGATVAVQNEHGTVGGQVMARIYFGENDRGWSPGNEVEVQGWAGYRVNDYVSVTARVHARGWGAIEGFDAALDPFRDPGELGLSYGGERVDLPVGVHIFIPDGTLAGHRIGFEWVSNVHEDLDGPWLAAGGGFVFSWAAGVGGN